MTLTPQTDVAVAQALMAQKAEIDRLRAELAASGDLLRALKRIERESRNSIGKGLGVASLAIRSVHMFAAAAIRAAEKKGVAP